MEEKYKKIEDIPEEIKEIRRERDEAHEDLRRAMKLLGYHKANLLVGKTSQTESLVKQYEQSSKDIRENIEWLIQEEKDLVAEMRRRHKVEQEKKAAEEKEAAPPPSTPAKRAPKMVLPPPPQKRVRFEEPPQSEESTAEDTEDVSYVPESTPPLQPEAEQAAVDFSQAMEEANRNMRAILKEVKTLGHNEDVALYNDRFLAAVKNHVYNRSKKCRCPICEARAAFVSNVNRNGGEISHGIFGPSQFTLEDEARISKQPPPKSAVYHSRYVYGPNEKN
jgi:hypothetical protein